MLVWGVLTLAALATPVTLSPTSFSWQALEGETSVMIAYLVTAALGVLGVIIAIHCRMPTLARGLLATLLGLAPLALPIVFANSLPPWQQLLELACVLVLVPSLLLRSAYTDSIVPRLLVTLCVIALVAPSLIPRGGDIPLVGLFKNLMDSSLKLQGVIEIARLALVILTLLVWMPGPATAGGTMFAWLVIFAIGYGPSLLDTARGMIAESSLEAVKHAPSAAVLWIIPTTCLAFVGYGLATVIGKQLE